MKTEQFTWGLILLSVGTILLFQNMGVIEFDWRAVFRLWPVLIIVAGLHVLLPKHRTGRVISILISAAAIGLLAYVGMTSADRAFPAAKSSRDNAFFKNSITQSYSDSIKWAQLTIEGGGASYKIDGSSDQYVFYAGSKVPFGPYHLLSRLPTTKDSTIRMRFRHGLQDEKERNLPAKQTDVQIHLHTKPIWDITLHMGAGKADFDLQDFRVSNLRYECGAASVNTRLGKPHGDSNIYVESGAASIKFEIPRSAACRILISSALSTKNFPDFVKQADGSYQTESYESAMDRYTIHLTGGVSTFAVNRYN